MASWKLQLSQLPAFNNLIPFKLNKISNKEVSLLHVYPYPFARSNTAAIVMCYREAREAQSCQMCV